MIAMEREQQEAQWFRLLREEVLKEFDTVEGLPAEVIVHAKITSVPTYTVLDGKGRRLGVGFSPEEAQAKAIKRILEKMIREIHDLQSQIKTAKKSLRWLKNWSE